MVRRLLAVLVFILFGLVLTPSAPAWACSCGEPRGAGDLVVVGVAESVRKPFTSDDLEVRLRVESVERGTAGDEVQLRTHSQGTACGYEFEEGYRYRVYANGGATTSCAGNERLAFAGREPEGPPQVLWWALGSGATIVAALILLRRRRRSR
ncbi:hypothetical protein [Actinoplanes friuliensis]|uniref:hypothetical protein n=1 Tax=Actinoplanes friuliensis TaxID=196914 RepID=UPI0005A1CAC2|nr:hypothetical protein [Actinoplanes friuliensis]